jgi:ATP-dependent Clp protease ATP-binding subunit ClpA
MPQKESKPKFADWLAPDTAATWRAANSEVLSLGHSWLGTEHLLLGLLHGPADDPAIRTLSELGVTRDEVRAALVRDLGSSAVSDQALLATMGIDLAQVRASVEATFGPDAIDELYDRRRRGGRRLARGPLCGFAMMPRAKLALERARRAATAEHRTLVNSSDLLMGLLEVKDGTAAQLLRNLGVDLDALRTRLRPRVAG